MKLDIATLMGNYCFPIVACIYISWFCKYIIDKNREDVKELNKEHKEEILLFRNELISFKDEVKDALENNTKVMEKLCDKLDN